MPSAFHGISTMSSALRAFQLQLDVTGHNIANVDTDGYTRQEVKLSAAQPTVFTQGTSFSLGNGVTVDSVSRIRDSFLQARRTASATDQGKADTLADTLSDVESVIPISSDGSISSSLDTYWSKWSQFASNPGVSTNQTAVQTAGQLLADNIRGTYGQLQIQKDQADTNIKDLLTQMQTSVNKIAELNLEIKNAGAYGGTPNDLMDSRDSEVQNLASIANIKVNKFQDGSYVISLGKSVLVDTSGPKTVPTSYDAATGTLTDGNGTYAITGGKLAGTMEAYNQIGAYQGRLDTLANTLRTEVNTLMSSGKTATGATGLKFFNDTTPQTGAVDFDLDSTGVVGPPAANGVKTDSTSITSGTSGNASDGGLALTISRLQTATVTSLGSTTFGNYYSNLASDVGNDVQLAKSRQSTQAAVVRQIDTQIQSNSGVNMDDEMASMLRIQRSYQAASKVLTAMNDMLGNLIDMVR